MGSQWDDIFLGHPIGMLFLEITLLTTAAELQLTAMMTTIITRMWLLQRSHIRSHIARCCSGAILGAILRAIFGSHIWKPHSGATLLAAAAESQLGAMLGAICWATF